MLIFNLEFVLLGIQKDMIKKRYQMYVQECTSWKRLAVI